MSQKTLFIDYSKCIGCETCEYICRFVHDTPRIHMVRTTSGMMAPLYCRHCEDPKCAKACTKGALVRDKDGALILQTMLCRGCTTRNCLLACPYAALLETDKGVMIAKCDLCAKRRHLGMLPACVEMCPCGAIHYIDREELGELETAEAKKAHDLLRKHISNP
ncbi:4Fe-4S dicluster domain-containing protein [Desulfovibrio inopinatus]|uniref:4Fe-4S dicluster domain-containing protein n=1 Tax=Desulfovibrio inopinatus TaxID=102109 RepID=UPI0003F724BA|nr:4Fe-4S dicluster domain-containing protein [Desulfovibrio inopinatus]